MNLRHALPVALLSLLLPLLAQENDDKATHREVEMLDVRFQRFGCLCLDGKGRLLAGDAGAKTIKVLSTDGKLLSELKPGLPAEAIAVAPNGAIYCGGGGKLAELTPDGKVVRTVPLPADAASAIPQRRRKTRPNQVSGIAVTKDYVFATIGSGWSVGAKAKLYRFNRELGDAKVLLTGLRGCCQRCDIKARDGIIYIAENGAYRVVRMTPEGKVLGRWGERGRTGDAGFGSCCNPMNLCFGKDGNLYTAESGLGRIKRYTADGKFLDLVGYAGVARFNRASGLAAACSNIAIVATANGDRVFAMDFKQGRIRVLERKPKGE